MEDERKGVFREDEVKNQPKKVYSTPQLTVHGTVEKITQAVGPGNKDGLVGSVLL
jgi:hypothetical protein